MMRQKQGPPALFVVVPAGSFNTTRREFESRFSTLPAQIASRLQVAEDIEGGWSRSFDVTETPAIFVVSARREFVWKAAGGLDPAELAAALDRHLIPAPRPAFRPLRLDLSTGSAAPDVFFQDDRGLEGALHRLRGQPVLITFWQDWSAPCLAELRRLQAMANARQDAAPSIIAFHGGKERKDFDDIRKEHGLSFSLVQDSRHVAARKFGVRCWPTTISISPDGMIEHVQLGGAADGNGRHYLEPSK
jgi:peroxiredoxin